MVAHPRSDSQVATFRAANGDGSGAEGDGDLLIREDNLFGTPEEDALRRDFTINSLFYDPIRDEIVDHAGGLDDIDRRLVRTIGNPSVTLIPSSKPIIFSGPSP